LRRPADAEGRVPRALLLGAPAAAPRVRVRADRPGGPGRVADARARQLRDADAGPVVGGEVGGGDGTGARVPDVRAADSAGLVPRARRAQSSRAEGPALAGH